MHSIISPLEKNATEILGFEAEGVDINIDQHIEQ